MNSQKEIFQHHNKADNYSRSVPPHTTLVILQKFLRANEGKLPEAKAQLLAALKWRKSYNPLAAKDEVFSKDKFGGLGYITKVKGAKLGAQKSVNQEDIVCFNIYGAAAKNSKETFGDTDAYVVVRYGPNKLPRTADTATGLYAGEWL